MANCQRVAIQNRDFRHEGFHRGHPQDADAKRPRPPASVASAASAQKAAAAAGRALGGADETPNLEWFGGCPGLKAADFSIKMVNKNGFNMI